MAQWAGTGEEGFGGFPFWRSPRHAGSICVAPGAVAEGPAPGFSDQEVGRRALCLEDSGTKVKPTMGLTFASAPNAGSWPAGSQIPFLLPQPWTRSFHRAAYPAPESFHPVTLSKSWSHVPPRAVVFLQGPAGSHFCILPTLITCVPADRQASHFTLWLLRTPLFYGFMHSLLSFPCVM